MRTTTRSSTVSLLAVLLAMGVAACDGSGAPLGTPGVVTTNGGPRPDRQLGRSLAALTAVDGCDDLLTELRAAAIRQMEDRVDENLQAAQNGGGCMYPGDAMASGGGSGGVSPNTSQRSDESAGDYTTTNTQVAGVDEADFVKNDGAYIYIIADDRFQIVDAWPPETAHLIASRGIEGTPKRLYVANDRAIIYSALGPIDSADTTGPWDRWGGSSGNSDCTYGYDCDFAGDGHELKVTIFDLTDRTDPQLVREIELSGSYINSRRIGEAIHTVVLFPGATFGGVRYWPEELGDYCWDFGTFSEERLTQMFEQLKLDNRIAIESAAISDFLPGVQDTRHVGDREVTEEGLLQSCENFYVDEQARGQSFLAVLSFDVAGVGAIHPTTTLGRPGAVYASHEALYVSTRHQRDDNHAWFYDDTAEAPQEASTVHKFNLVNDPPRSFYAGSGVVKGRVLNQFAMDEHEGYLRIATTTGHVSRSSGSEVHSTLTVLHEHGGTLVESGIVDQIAPTEDIRSVRFAGERGFIVTFKKTDPLFVLDLADPARPEIAGELKIPGFSTYMHPLDADHILSIGYDADDQGDFAWFTGIMLQIFDVSDPRDPRLTHKEVIGSRGSTSEAATNHLGFTYFASRNLLAIPMTICEGTSGGGSYGERMTFSGLLVYRASTRLGFEQLGGVAHRQPETEDTYWNACSNWWTDSNSIVKRSIFMDDYVFSITEDEIKVDSVFELGTDLSVIDLLR